ncbi:MAG: D-alanine--D-alanine ligase [Flavobacteriaceae bacterium]
MNEKIKKNIAIIMGGYSSEFDISIKSGNVVYQHLDKNRYRGYRVIITKDGWIMVDEEGKEYPIDRHDFTVKRNNDKIKFDCVFNAIHGTPGEDGIMQAYFELIGLPHTTCGSYQAALSFNKRDFLSVMKPYGVQSARSYYLDKGDAVSTDKILDKVGLPCFVKPNKSGSSFGMSKVHRKEDLAKAIEIAFKEDDEIIIEAFLDGIEVSVGVLRYKGKTKVLPVTEIVSQNDFFDYEAKYEGKSEEITPARISKEQEGNVREAARKAYEILKMKGYSRSEFIFIGNQPFMLEMNATPGLTAESILPQQAKEAGIDLPELFGSAIEDALSENQ